MSTEPDADFAAKLAEIPDPAAGSAAIVPQAPSLPSLPSTPTRAEVSARRMIALLGSGVWLALHLLIYGVRRDFATLSSPYIAVQILLPALLAAASLFLALGRGRLGLGVRIGLVIGLAALGPTCFALVGAAAPPPRSVDAAAGSLLGMVVCFDITVAWAAVPLLAAAVVLRGAFVAGALWRSTLLGGAIGLFAGATMNLHCPNIAPTHVAVGHGLAVLVATLLGAFVLTHRTRP